MLITAVSGEEVIAGLHFLSYLGFICSFYNDHICITFENIKMKTSSFQLMALKARIVIK